MKHWLPLLIACLLAGGCTGSTTYVDFLPEIYPDYIGVTVPAGIAPMNFNLPEEYDRVFVKSPAKRAVRSKYADAGPISP